MPCTENFDAFEHICNIKKGECESELSSVFILYVVSISHSPVIKEKTGM